MERRRILILGSTGSVGKQCLEVVRKFPQKFEVVGLSAGSNVEELKKQVLEFSPKAVHIANGNLENVDCKVFKGESEFKNFIEFVDFDVALCAISGSAGVIPTYLCALKGKRIALANKESLVCAGMFITEVAKEIVPVDSEHSALFQCLRCVKREEVEEIILTASGGPFRNREDLESVTPEEALVHPNWKMGKKVTVDSATLMNKGLEVIEAYWLFSFPYDKIKVVIHPQSVVHSLVKLKDGSLISQISAPDMRIPIAYAISFPERLELEKNFNLAPLKIEFFEPDTNRFPCLKLAYQSLKMGYPYPIVLNSADEVAVEMFLKGLIKFTDIPKIVEETLNRFNGTAPKNIEEVIEIDKVAKEIARKVASS